jgi:hypothetical protein
MSCRANAITVPYLGRRDGNRGEPRTASDMEIRELRYPNNPTFFYAGKSVEIVETLSRT